MEAGTAKALIKNRTHWIENLLFQAPLDVMSLFILLYSHPVVLASCTQEMMTGPRSITLGSFNLNRIPLTMSQLAL